MNPDLTFSTESNHTVNRNVSQCLFFFVLLPRKRKVLNEDLELKHETMECLSIVLLLSMKDNIGFVTAKKTTKGFDESINKDFMQTVFKEESIYVSRESSYSCPLSILLRRYFSWLLLLNPSSGSSSSPPLSCQRIK